MPSVYRKWDADILEGPEGSGTDGARDALGIPDGAARASFYLS